MKKRKKKKTRGLWRGYRGDGALRHIRIGRGKMRVKERPFLPEREREREGERKRPLLPQRERERERERESEPRINTRGLWRGLRGDGALV